LICGKDGANVLATFLLDVDTSTLTCWPSDFSWSTKESTSLDLPPNLIAFELIAGLLRGKTNKIFKLDFETR
jgi:hypothetical protein